MNPVIPSLLLFIMIMASGVNVAGEVSVNPGINSHYHDARHADWVPVFESASREVYAQRHAVVTALDIKPGMRIADIGAGTGFYSLLFAERTGPEGLVYAVDIAEDFIRAIKKKAELAGATNLTGIINNGRESGLAPQTIDLAFICHTYHHFEYPKTTISSIHRALLDDGEVVIIDFRTDPDISSAWVQGHVRAGREQVIREMGMYGFELVADLPLLQTNYFLRFKKR
ncbi:MAG: methyltransferase domain-containing protein [Gammaproteobacteria bacterium]|nr:methyltransferase domain-containing protein [Gammaproteobacteria bacterium]